MSVDFSKVKILVTGGAGYIGSILTGTLLSRGYKVKILDNLMYDQTSLLQYCHDPNFEFIKGDVRDKELMKGLLKDVDIIIPLAAIVGAPACENNPKSAQSINLEAIKMLNFLRSNNQWVIFPTTNSGYGTTTGEIYCTEETPLKPISLYGKTKVEAEKILLDSKNTITLRLATVFGVSPRMRIDLLVNYFVYEAVIRGYLVIYEKDFKRNYIHIRDVADCFIYCIEHFEEMKGEPYNVGLNEANLSKEELANKIKEHIPSLYIHYSEIGCDPDKRNYIVSNDKIMSKGFKAKWSIDYGIKELIKGYKMIPKGKFCNA